MSENNRSYRIRTKIGDQAPNVLNVKLEQTYDMFEILTLKLRSEDIYKTHTSDYGVLVGRVNANGNFGVPNVKISVFIEAEDTDSEVMKLLYPYKNVNSKDNDGIRYNLLPDYKDEKCYNAVGTFPNKRLLLDNDDIIEVFDKYWKYTTCTNASGDYMIFGVPANTNVTVHVEADLSDIGILSQKPYDMISRGYNLGQFDSPNKFKSSTNLDSLPQIHRQDKGVYVYPFWGDTSDTSDTVAITRCDIQLNYDFETTCVFMGSVVTDTGSNAIGKNCGGTTSVGRMDALVAGEGTIEMIRKTLDGKIEEFKVKGGRVIDSNGVFCYQIPMNLDLIMTDELGRIVPTDDPNKGIATRAKVRFRFSVDDTVNDDSARKRCRYLVPNNPRMDDDYPIFKSTKYVNYEFGSNTREEDFRDLLWDNVYTVKSYIPRLQKNNGITNRKHTGIKWINKHGDNNPFPYNGLTIKLAFTYRLICVIVKVIIFMIKMINTMLSLLGEIPCRIGNLKLPLIGRPFKFLLKLVPSCIKLSSNFCDDGVNKNTYYPGCKSCTWDKTKEDHNKEQKSLSPEDRTVAVKSDSQLETCIENELAQQNEATSFNFYNDWINGCLYFPMWYRKITPKKSYFFGLFKRRAKDQWCSSDKKSGGMRKFYQCAVERNNTEKSSLMIPSKNCGDSCHEKTNSVSYDYGVVVTMETMLGQTVYYYKSVEYDDGLVGSYPGEQGDVKLLFATDIVLLGNLNECNQYGIPQFFKSLQPTTYNLPEDILFTDNEVVMTEDSKGNITVSVNSDVEMTGCDWGNINKNQECGDAEDGDGGLFYGIGCSAIDMKAKSCVNVTRICEYGVSLDEAKSIPDLSKISTDNNEENYGLLIPDGFISFDELYNINERSMFATMNGNNLRLKLNHENGLYEYDFNYLYTENFDGSMYEIMKNRQKSCTKTYRFNYQLEKQSDDYIKFRYGVKDVNDAYFYDGNKKTLPRYENSFYFYFGLKDGKTALHKFISNYYSDCEEASGEVFSTNVLKEANSWCLDEESDGNRDGYLALDMTGISSPYKLTIQYSEKSSDKNDPYNETIVIEDIIDEKIIITGNKKLYETEDGGFMDYTPITWKDEEDKERSSLDNGVFTLTILDSEGYEVSSEVEYVDSYISFGVENQKFRQPNNLLFREFDDYDSVAKDGINGLKDNEDDSYEYKVRDIGGMIVLHDFYYHNEVVSSNQIKVEVKPLYVSDFDGSEDFGNNKIYDGETASGTSNNEIKFETVEGKTVVYIGIPKGGVDYKVTVKMLCNGKESLNYVTQIIRVDEPTPYKLFINDIDYEIIRNFKTGWENGEGSFNGIKGWLNISNIGGIELLKENVSYSDFNSMAIKLMSETITGSDYTWTKEYRYVKPDNYPTEADWNELIEEDKLKFIEGVNEIIQARLDFVVEMKTAFYLTCEDSDKSITLFAQTDDHPVDYKFLYIEEEKSEDETHNVIVDKDYQGTDGESYVDGIKIPTITNIDNEYYGKKSEKKDGNICFGYAPKNNGKYGHYKKPYFVACVNALDKTIPTKVSGHSNGEWDDYGKFTNDLFGIHILDKVFKVNFTAWAYIDDIPYYDVTDEDKIGKSVKMNGVLGAYIYNGIPESFGENSDVYFSEQTYAGKKLLIKTLNGYGEDDIPTKRIICGYEPTSGYEYKHYPNYLSENGLTNEVNGISLYIPVTKRTENLELLDSGCSITQNIYGKLKLRAGSSLNDCIDKSKSTLNMSVSNGDNEETFYIYKYDGSNYPINDIEIDGETFKFGYTSADAYGLMKYGMDSDGFIEKVDESVRGEIVDDESGETKEVKGYGTTGNFKKFNSEGQYFVIARTANGCMTISPVYDYTNVTYGFRLLKETVTTYTLIESEVEVDVEVNVTVTVPTESVDEETGESVSGSDIVPGGGEGSGEGSGKACTETKTDFYKLGIFIYNADKLYYFKNYEYTIEFSTTINNMTFTGSSVITREMVEKSEDGIVCLYVVIDKTIYDKLKRANLPIVGSSIIDGLVDNTNVYATDFTSLRHRCKYADKDKSFVVEAPSEVVDCENSHCDCLPEGVTCEDGCIESEENPDEGGDEEETKLCASLTISNDSSNNRIVARYSRLCLEKITINFKVILDDDSEQTGTIIVNDYTKEGYVEVDYANRVVSFDETYTTISPTEDSLLEYACDVKYTLTSLICNPCTIYNQSNVYSVSIMFDEPVNSDLEVEFTVLLNSGLSRTDKLFVNMGQTLGQIAFNDADKVSEFTKVSITPNTDSKYDYMCDVGYSVDETVKEMKFSNNLPGSFIVSDQNSINEIIGTGADQTFDMEGVTEGNYQITIPENSLLANGSICSSCFIALYVDAVNLNLNEGNSYNVEYRFEGGNTVYIIVKATDTFEGNFELKNDAVTLSFTVSKQ